MLVHLGTHHELLEVDADPARIRAECVRPSLAVALDAVAVIVAFAWPVAMLVVWAASLVFLAATSEEIDSLRGRRAAWHRIPSDSRRRHEGSLLP
jgi:hypothetical protein